MSTITVYDHSGQLKRIYTEMKGTARNAEYLGKFSASLLPVWLVEPILIGIDLVHIISAIDHKVDFEATLLPIVITALAVIVPIIHVSLHTIFHGLKKNNDDRIEFLGREIERKRRAIAREKSRIGSN